MSQRQRYLQPAVNCRIGSLENVDGETHKAERVNCRIGSLEIELDIW